MDFSCYRFRIRMACMALCWCHRHWPHFLMSTHPIVFIPWIQSHTNYLTMISTTLTLLKLTVRNQCILPHVVYSQHIESPHIIPNWKMSYSASEEYGLDNLTPNSWAGLVKRYINVLRLCQKNVHLHTDSTKTRVWSWSISKIFKCGAPM